MRKFTGTIRFDALFDAALFVRVAGASLATASTRRTKFPAGIAQFREDLGWPPPADIPIL
jgi:hypothetical protein